MPGHATAAIAAYPTLGAGTGAVRVSANWGVLHHLFNLEPQTFSFLENVLAEVAELFPSPIIHIGGDEVVKDEWNASRQVRARAIGLGIQDPNAVQAYFTQRISRFLAAQGRRIVGWDEILRTGLRHDAIVMSWHGVSGAHLAAVAGNDTVLAPDPGLYFDHRQSTLPEEPPGRLNVLSLEDVYRFEPHDASLSDGERSHVLGLQANLWTEHMQTEERVQWMALPRSRGARRGGLDARSAPQLARLPRAPRPPIRTLSGLRLELCRQRVCPGRANFARRRRTLSHFLESADSIKPGAERHRPSRRHPLHPRRQSTLCGIAALFNAVDPACGH